MGCCVVRIELPSVRRFPSAHSHCLQHPGRESIRLDYQSPSPHNLSPVFNFKKEEYYHYAANVKRGEKEEEKRKRFFYLFMRFSISASPLCTALKSKLAIEASSPPDTLHKNEANKVGITPHCRGNKPAAGGSASHTDAVGWSAYFAHDHSFLRFILGRMTGV